MTKRTRSARGRDNAQPTLRLREPVDVLGAIPYIVGYHPEDSIVVVGMRRKQLYFTVRVDVVPPDEVPALVDSLLRVVLGQAVTGVLIVGYGADERIRPIVLGLRTAYRRAAIDVVEAMRADDGRYWSYLCADPSCCPPEGSPYDAGASPVAAQATLAGRVAMPDRSTYEQQIRPVGGIGRMAMAQAADRADERMFALISRPPDEAGALAGLMTAGEVAVLAALDKQRRGDRLDDDEVAWLAALLEAIPVRDLAWERITGPPEELNVHRSLWMDVMRRCDADLIAGPGSLFAFAAWRLGEAKLAGLALERVLRDDPGYTMAIMIKSALDRGLPPSTLRGWPRRGPGWPDRTGSGVRRPPGRRPRRRSSSRREGSRRG